MIRKGRQLWALLLVIVTSFLTFVATNTLAISVGNRVVISKQDFQVVKDLQKHKPKNYIKDNLKELRMKSLLRCYERDVS